MSLWNSRSRSGPEGRELTKAAQGVGPEVSSFPRGLAQLGTAIIPPTSWALLCQVTVTASHDLNLPLVVVLSPSTRGSSTTLHLPTAHTRAMDILSPTFSWDSEPGLDWSQGFSALNSGLIAPRQKTKPRQHTFTWPTHPRSSRSF